MGDGEEGEAAVRGLRGGQHASHRQGPEPRHRGGAGGGEEGANAFGDTGSRVEDSGAA